ncbi:MAG: LysE family translocator [Actinomycetota bacterium]
MLDGFPFLRGIAIGFALAAPIGPVGILCIRKALNDGRVAAFVAGLGAALADTVFAAVAAAGIGVALAWLADWATVIKAVGGTFMVVLGVGAWRAAAVAVEPDAGAGPGPWRDFLSTFAVTITNPFTILGAAGAFAAFGSGIGVALVGGVFIGSALWWLVLALLVAAVRTRFTPERMRLVNHASGALLVVFGLAALASLAF